MWIYFQISKVYKRDANRDLTLFSFKKKNNEKIIVYTIFKIYCTYKN